MLRRLLPLLLAATLWAHALQQAEPVFRITPVRPVEELRREALAATPPVEHDNFRKPELTELVTLDPTIKLDIRYATANNFLSTPMYSQARAFLQRPAALALVRAHRELKKSGYGLLIHDAYRPWYVTKMFWDATPPDKHHFVADPATGSRHNRGCAVDLTLYDLRTGQAVEMPSLYDEFSVRAYPGYSGGTPEQRRHRELLRAAMEKQGFTVYEFEWWHFDYKDYARYPILNIPFEKLGPEASPVKEDPPAASGPPNRSLEKSVERTATLVAVIDENGKVRNVYVRRGVGKGLDEKAVEAVRKWKFEPATKDGKPVAVQVLIDIKFRLYPDNSVEILPSDKP